MPLIHELFSTTKPSIVMFFSVLSLPALKLIKARACLTDKEQYCVYVCDVNNLHHMMILIYYEIHEIFVMHAQTVDTRSYFFASCAFQCQKRGTGDEAKLYLDCRILTIIPLFSCS